MKNLRSVRRPCGSGASEDPGSHGLCVPAAVAPGPRGSWLLGSAAEFRRNPLQLFQNGTEQYGDVVRFRLAHVIVHLLNHPRHVQQVLRSPSAGFDRRSRSAGKIRAVCGNSLLTSHGEDWKAQRRMLQTAMHPGTAFDPRPAIDAAVRSMLRGWEMAANLRQPIDLTSEMQHVTFAIAAQVIFGFTPTSEDLVVMERCLSEVLEHTWQRLEKLLDLETVFPFLAGRRFRTALAELDEVVLRIIRQPRKSGGPSSDVLSVLFRSCGVRNDTAADCRQLRDHVLTLLLSGHETTASALTWALILLARHPAVQDQLREELANDGQDRRLALRVFQETIRLYPSIWVMERRVIRDEVAGGFRIPAGSSVVICPWLLHRHREFWDAPETFDPDRFLPRNQAERPESVYLPFGAGPHRCIGQHLATLIAREIIARVVTACRLTPVSRELPPAVPGITLRHRQPVQVIAEFPERKARQA